MKKNDLFTVAIEDMSEDGAGIGRTDGYIWFVKDTVIGDVVEAGVMKMKKNYGFARLVRIIDPSPSRVEPECPVARQCGGCQLQAMSYEEQLRFKERKIRNHLSRLGGIPADQIPMEPIMGMEKGACSTTLGPNLTARSSAHHGIVQLVCGRRKASNAEYDMICDAS